MRDGNGEYEEIVENPDRQGDGDDVGNGAEGVPSERSPGKAPDRSYGGGAPARHGGGGGAVPEPPPDNKR